MSARGMSFRFDPDNQALKESGFLYDVDSETQKYLKSYFSDEHGYEDYVTMYVRSVECCGWLEVSGRLDKHLKVNDLAILKLLMKEPLIKHCQWKKVSNMEPTFGIIYVISRHPTAKGAWVNDQGYISMYN